MLSPGKRLYTSTDGLVNVLTTINSGITVIVRTIRGGPSTGVDCASVHADETVRDALHQTSARGGRLLGPSSSIEQR